MANFVDHMEVTPIDRQRYLARLFSEYTASELISLTEDDLLN